MDTLPPLPPKLRPKPQRRDIGPGKRYCDVAAFDADHEAWEQERAARKEQVAEREKAKQKARDRSARSRTSEVGDNERRVWQKWQQHTRQHTFVTPTVQTFFRLVKLTRQNIAANSRRSFDQVLEEWDMLLGRNAGSPPDRGTHLPYWKFNDSSCRKQEHATMLRAAGVSAAADELDINAVYVGDMQDGRRHGKGVWPPDRQPKPWLPLRFRGASTYALE